MSTNNSHHAQNQQLLLHLKNTAEGLLIPQVMNVWSVYGGLIRMFGCLDKILRHGLLAQDYRTFVQGLERLQPSSSNLCNDCEFRPHLPAMLAGDKASIWLYRSLETHSLSRKLMWLLDDKQHLAGCYHEWAFLRQEPYTLAMRICLRAVERNQASLLTDIQPHLFLKAPSVMYNVESRFHRRCSSFPNFNGDCIQEEQQNSSKAKLLSGTTATTPLRRWCSEPSMHSAQSRPSFKNNMTSITLPNTPLKSFLLPKPTCTSLTMDSNKPRFFNLNRILEALSPLERGQECIKISRHSSFMEDGGSSVLPMATRYYPRPTKGQTLHSFLTSSQLRRTRAELDRENAHFSISDAIISAMEQIKCDQKLATLSYASNGNEQTKQKIRVRRKTSRSSSNTQLLLACDSSMDEMNTATTISSSGETDSDCSVADLDIESHPSNDTLSISMASLYSDADIAKIERTTIPECTQYDKILPSSASSSSTSHLNGGGGGGLLTAESVALSLISKFSDAELPKASDLEWQVTDEDNTTRNVIGMSEKAPFRSADATIHQRLAESKRKFDSNQKSLRRLSSTPSVQMTELRGTRDWAPPRPQIIFTPHPTPARKVLMEKQQYQCAGCGMKVSPQYASKYRYCHYVGRYFCTGCHTNQIALIPGRVLYRWDFKQYPVSKFSYRLLEQMHTDPLFRIFDLNANAERMSNNLKWCKTYRNGLALMRDYIFSCRYAEDVKEQLQHDLPSYILTEPGLYSLQDLISVRTGAMKPKLKGLAEMCYRHTSDCDLCLARGYICELCRSDDVIFPWQQRTVHRCPICSACYHMNCWKKRASPQDCVKCHRLHARHSLQSTTAT